MIILVRRIVYFGSLLVALMTIILMMIKDDIGHVPHGLQVTMLSIIFVLGMLLIYLISRKGMGG